MLAKGSSNLNKGKSGEKKAADFLKEKGYQIVATNYWTRWGEIDVVAKDKDFLVFVEVKTRSSNQLGFPEEAVTPSKIKNLLRAAHLFLAKEKLSAERYRVDVVSIILGNKGEVSDLKIYQNITGE